jgi:amino acid transporter
MKKISHPKLNQYLATAICGNDILSSALYVSGIAIVYAGVYAPIVLAVIGLVLFFYKSVYTEVVEALPINGGAYNCLLNSTAKPFAAIAGITTILSYMATAVISGYVAVNYLHSVIPSISLIPTTIALLLAFALLVISGLKDSAKVALAIFALHIGVLSLFVIMGFAHALQGNSFLVQNMHSSVSVIQNRGGLVQALFFAFAASLLGVSGFESSANFVEEQDAGVFRKTLRNMLAGVVIFNPLIALVVLISLPLAEIAKSTDFILANSAVVIGGEWLRYLVIADAFLVLSGAVLTAYVGVGGLISRMASDHCLPAFFNFKNAKGSYPRIVISFFALCVSILLITKGDLFSMAGVYTIAFLSVMTLFALGNLILRQTRPDLKRTYHAPLFFVIFAMIATFFGVLGNIIIDRHNLYNFIIYFVPAVLGVLTVVYMDNILMFILRLTRGIPFIHTFVMRHFTSVTSGTLVAFLRNPRRLYDILQYVNRNETGHNLILVHCKEEAESEFFSTHDIVANLLPALKQAGVFNHLNIRSMYIDEEFGPETVNKIAKKLKVPNNHILIGAIHHTHPFDYADLGGVRIVL